MASTSSKTYQVNGSRLPPVNAATIDTAEESSTSETNKVDIILNDVNINSYSSIVTSSSPAVSKDCLETCNKDTNPTLIEDNNISSPKTCNNNYKNYTACSNLKSTNIHEIISYASTSSPSPSIPLTSNFCEATKTKMATVFATTNNTHSNLSTSGCTGKSATNGHITNPTSLSNGHTSAKANAGNNQDGNCHQNGHTTNGVSQNGINNNDITKRNQTSIAVGESKEASINRLNSLNSPATNHHHFHHSQHHLLSPQHSFNGLDAAAAAAAAALCSHPSNNNVIEDSEPIFMEYSSSPDTNATSNNSFSLSPKHIMSSNSQQNGNSKMYHNNSPSHHRESHYSNHAHHIDDNDVDNHNDNNDPRQQQRIDHRDDLLCSINALRKQGQFCDVKLVVEEHEVSAHRAVLALTSPYLFDFLSCLEECESGSITQPQTYRLKDVPYVGFEHLLDYMYTGKLHVPLNEVPLVYGTAIALRMDVPARACATFLSSHLSEANCLVIRRFSRDNEFRSAVDEYIRSHIEGILNRKSFFGLNHLQVEVVGLDESIDDETMERRLFSLVLDWAKTRLNDLKPKMERLTEQVNVLHLNQDNTLTDCADMEDSVLSSDDDVVIDYKKLARRRCKTKTKALASPSGSNGTPERSFHKFHLNPEEAVSVAEREWSIVATQKTNEKSYLSIAVLDGQLMAVSIHVRPTIPPTSDGTGSGNDPDSPTSVGNQSGKGSSPPMYRKASIAPLEMMSTARCAMGAVEIDGDVVVFGGYDRGECLQSAESFNLQENRWTSLPSMKAARGRFSAAALDGFVYTCGGSDGWKELSCVERFEPSTGEWKFVASMIKERSSHGVATFNGKLYCIGGSDGQRSIADCEVYDPSTNKWSQIASLNQARTQTCVCAFQGMLYAIGGTDQWNTLNSVEVYDPDHNQWILGSNLNIARRGAGVDIVDGTMIVVGGSDGASSLTSLEWYHSGSMQWTVGPQMATPRANLSAVTVGRRLFAIGGFSGKKFLSTTEWLDWEDREWLGHAPRMDLNTSIRSSESDVEK